MQNSSNLEYMYIKTYVHNNKNFALASTTHKNYKFKTFL